MVHADDAIVGAGQPVNKDGVGWHGTISVDILFLRADEGSSLAIDPEAETTCCRVSHFGNWLRLVGDLPEGSSAKVIVYLVLKE